ncbi:amidohydrolase family protein [Desulfurivibrio sp. D14AmB]|uniref:amidohydrolase family protein n=1 Tax=Desulfurivibrio sp. D14AmB TaxID=3374370 RepID=UPI00376EDFDA
MPVNNNKTLFIVAGSFIDGLGGAVRRNIALTIREGIITAIAPAAELPCRDQAIITDLSHCTLLPALADCSLSLARSPSVDKRAAPAQATLIKRHIHYCQIHGVLGVADGGAPAGRVEAAPGELVEIRAAGADFLKIAGSADIEEENAFSPRLTRAELDRLLQQRGDRKAVVVANGRPAVAEALAAGCDAIEQGYGMGEDNLRRMAAAGVLWIPGLLRAKNALDAARGGGDVCCRFSQRYVAPGKPLPGAEALWRQTLAAQLAQLRLAKKLGVNTAVGTGAGSMGIIHGEAVAEEIKLFIKAGYTLTEAIGCASTSGAAFFGLQRPGPLTVGRPATFLMTRGTPQQLPRKLSYLEGLYIDGAPSASL